MKDPMRLYQEEARSVRPSDDLEKRTVELIQRLEQEEGASPSLGESSSSITGRTSRRNRSFNGVLRYAALAVGIAIALFAAVPAVFQGNEGAVMGEASAIELESNRVVISDPRSAVLEVDGDEAHARIVLNAKLLCTNTGGAPITVSVGSDSCLFIRVYGQDEWRSSVVLENAEAERVELSVIVSVDEADIEAFQTGSGLAEAAYARLMTQASQQFSVCSLSLECEGFAVTEYAIEPEFETDWRTVRRMINAGDRLTFSLLPR